ncbi:nuclear transport factor 2 family protein [Streptomyces albipurpureus]|uniref:Nuclear transport factor 2 family protein n=1 Tax=Streptomyces albipurpureus TaxID=2897419 RepID=A0ABT0UG40_9ACTN|nr:nuclear transport factor 2 family protein [Streptomyces sp. CWNU-1]MCM2387035.1 nuclear transport factor 2 family protein [Streptomyces sp. CWNU-1]
MSNAEQVVDAFLAAFDRLDPDELAGYFAEDGVYHSMPLEPIVGQQRIRAYFAQFLERFTSMRFTVHHQAVSPRGDVIFNERTDSVTPRTGKAVDIPVVGVFEIRDGLIVAWRDYFDLAAVRDAP